MSLHRGRPSIPPAKGLFYLEMRTVHHFKLNWQLENVEQLAKSWEKMFYINICTYKLAEGHKYCTQGQNPFGTAHQGMRSWGRQEGDASLILSLRGVSKGSLDPAPLGRASPEGGAIKDRSTKFGEG